MENKGKQQRHHIYLPRGGGKTTQITNYAIKYNCNLIVHNYYIKKWVEKNYSDFNHEIFSISSFDSSCGVNNPNFVVDNIDLTVDSFLLEFLLVTKKTYRLSKRTPSNYKINTRDFVEFVLTENNPLDLFSDYLQIKFLINILAISYTDISDVEEKIIDKAYKRRIYFRGRK